MWRALNVLLLASAAVESALLKNVTICAVLQTTSPFQQAQARVHLSLDWYQNRTVTHPFQINGEDYQAQIKSVSASLACAAGVEEVEIQYLVEAYQKLASINATDQCDVFFLPYIDENFQYAVGNAMANFTDDGLVVPRVVIHSLISTATPVPVNLTKALDTSYSPRNANNLYTITVEIFKRPDLFGARAGFIVAPFGTGDGYSLKANVEYMIEAFKSAANVVDVIGSPLQMPLDPSLSNPVPDTTQLALALQSWPKDLDVLIVLYPTTLYSQAIESLINSAVITPKAVFSFLPSTTSSEVQPYIPNLWFSPSPWPIPPSAKGYPFEDAFLHLNTTGFIDDFLEDTGFDAAMSYSDPVEAMSFLQGALSLGGMMPPYAYFAANPNLTDSDKANYFSSFANNFNQTVFNNLMGKSLYSTELNFTTAGVQYNCSTYSTYANCSQLSYTLNEAYKYYIIQYVPSGTTSNGTVLYTPNDVYSGSLLFPAPFPTVQSQQVDQALGIVLMVFAAVLMATFAALVAFVQATREKPLIKASSPFFLQVMAVASIGRLVIVFTAYPVQNEVLCNANQWIAQIFHTILFVTLVAKTFRLKRALSIKGMVKLPDSKLASYILGVTLVIVVALSISTAVSPLQVSTLLNPNNPLQGNQLCTENVWSYIYVGIQVLLYSVIIYLSFLIRRAPAAFNESRFLLAYCFFSLVIAIFEWVLIFQFWKDKFVNYQFAARALYVILDTIFLLFIFFGPKVYAVTAGFSSVFGSSVKSKDTSSNKKNSSDQTDNELPLNQPLVPDEFIDELKGGSDKRRIRLLVSGYNNLLTQLQEQRRAGAVLQENLLRFCNVHGIDAGPLARVGEHRPSGVSVSQEQKSNASDLGSDDDSLKVSNDLLV